jgi:hypothetical protein
VLELGFEQILTIFLIFTESRKPVPPIPVLHSDSDTDSQDNDADVEDSDECDEDEDDEDVDEIMALDHSGQTRYGHLSPSQLRMHPNYCGTYDYKCHICGTPFFQC